MMLVHISSAGVDAIIDDEDGLLVTPYRWYLDGNGYVVTSVLHPEGGFVSNGHGSRRRRRTLLCLSRLIMSLEYGDPREVDHINHDPLDNCRSNLEILTPAENAQNIRSRRGSSSQYRGVGWKKELLKWKAYGTLDRQLIHLGYFTSEEEAGRVAAEWRAEHMPYSDEGRMRHG